jgi:hypothetical protein
MDAARMKRKGVAAMVAPLITSQRIVCTAVRIDEPGVSRGNRLAYKPSALVPWADPYIAGLVRRLQSEVRFERASVMAPHADLEPPSPSFDPDWDGWDPPQWRAEDDPTE